MLQVGVSVLLHLLLTTSIDVAFLCAIMPRFLPDVGLPAE